MDIQELAALAQKPPVQSKQMPQTLALPCESWTQAGRALVWVWIPGDVLRREHSDRKGLKQVLPIVGTSSGKTTYHSFCQAVFSKPKHLLPPNSKYLLL